MAGKTTKRKPKTGARAKSTTARTVKGASKNGGIFQELPKATREKIQKFLPKGVDPAVYCKKVLTAHANLIAH